MKTEICQLFIKVGKDYRKKGVADLFQLHPNKDIHAYYRLTKNPSQVIHIQGYPRMSTNEEARVFARMIDYDKMMKIKKSGSVSPENEHEATIRSLPNFDIGIMLPYNPKVLEDKLEEMIPELR